MSVICLNFMHRGEGEHCAVWLNHAFVFVYAFVCFCLSWGDSKQFSVSGGGGGEVRKKMSQLRKIVPAPVRLYK